MLPEDIVQGMVAELYPSKQIVKQEAMKLAGLVQKANGEKWTPSSRKEKRDEHLRDYQPENFGNTNNATQEYQNSFPTFLVDFT